MNQLIHNSGVFLLNKPYGWTSFDVVGKIRKLLIQYTQEKLKVGHAGTLDPLATGLMIVCIGKETKSISLYTQYDKTYHATVNFSGSTASFDLETPIDKYFEYHHVTENDVIRTLQSFKGQIWQVPPEFSAKWIEGKRAYHLARKGQVFELPPASVHIHHIQLLQFSPPEFTFTVTCSKGTYIRALVRDIGKKLTGGAYITKLERTAIGPYTIEEAMSIENFEKMLKLARNL
ncbi:MAG: tRNA pseudouridine(55) synthase TruB [Bacteroidales bacterium]|nr:tRNA pseudouridine(55) synthase TruB [Bacteroidales bacterium]